MSIDSLKTKSQFSCNDKNYQIFALNKLAETQKVSKLPFALKVLLENVLRNEDGLHVSVDDIHALINWQASAEPSQQIAFTPGRVVLQDFTGVPAIVDLAAMRDAVVSLGGSAESINPQVPVDLVIDHSVMVDHFGDEQALQKNIELEFSRNEERYRFLRWGQQAFNNFRVVPPGTGIVHQVNLEYLASVVMQSDDNQRSALYPDTLVGTDSHTTMINGLGVLGWGVGGIEAEAAMLGQPISMLIPQVVGFKLVGKLPEGATATDLVLTVTDMLRKKGVVGKFVEFFGDGLSDLPLADRATIANMAPEYGATCGIFPIDEETIKYLKLTGRSDQHCQLVERYAKAQGLWRVKGEEDAQYSDTLTLDLADVEPSIAGPKRPQDRISLSDTHNAFIEHMQLQGIEIKDPELSVFDEDGGAGAIGTPPKDDAIAVNYKGKEFHLKHGDIVIAAITSCTNTSNPEVMVAAGLLAQKALAKGLTPKPWVKTSLAPGSQVVPAYLEKAGVMDALNALGFELVGFGCTTCIGNSGPLPEPIETAIQEGNLTVASVLSGNRNFEGRIHQEVRANYLASPPLVVAYSLAGSMTCDIYNSPLGYDRNNDPVFLRDIWPSQKEVGDVVAGVLSSDLFRQSYEHVFEGSEKWQSLTAPSSETYTWPASTYVKNPPFFEDMPATPPKIEAINDAQCLVLVGDSITTDHISPAGAIKADSEVGEYLTEAGVATSDFNSLGSRRGNHEVMMRGTFGNVRLQNKLVPDTEGGFTRYFPTQKTTSIYQAAMQYQQNKVPLVVIAGKEYGTGSSRDWAAKGTRLLGVKAVIAESYERIHRSNLVGFGVVPLEFKPGDSAQSLGLDGSESFSIPSLADHPDTVTVIAKKQDGDQVEFTVNVRIDTKSEWQYYEHEGILHYVLRQLANG
ncbi:aconitate hydratase AcnA [Alteromonas sediminis]|uniref:Aconitate hydratase n=1 Tax=Alteromonas sediminis TaxID=2259342 RepID=A0A3N5Y070_9ALTE|nr:aconitate hydratase AcnA [Alteromonas sediminis]RPJ67007.1 aconitate hydratase AcnA [Alteromonas sediminis]